MYGRRQLLLVELAAIQEPITMPAAASAILIVEDESMLAELLADNLRDGGYDIVGPAADVATALLLVETAHIGAALLDVYLPGGTVDDVADALVRRGIPFAFSSGSDSSRIAARHRSRPTLQKPFNADALLRMAATLIESGAGFSAAPGKSDVRS